MVSLFNPGAGLKWRMLRYYLGERPIVDPYQLTADLKNSGIN
jgi:hypothetical protein